MTGKELIEWIQRNKAEDLECVVQYRDDGGTYLGGEILEQPTFAKFDRYPHGYDIKITYLSTSPNCIVF